MNIVKYITLKLRFHNVRILVRVRNYVRRYVRKFKRLCFHLSAKDIRKNVRKNHKCQIVFQNQQTKVDSLPKDTTGMSKTESCTDRYS